ncbi:tyrosine-protein kinase transmembrane receptor Ror isoform X1 [Procambarus clarkii]|uniref:tyrosine-protein kinase transmembrane receptor Ror isoform X1 n=1 Tax=Procambarus clarkii TaxID=6728 RepID=UPI001E673B80|nr:inactive tyrosine-protein kinase transmembrane receptor ROR1-like isoform X1 [Procambarus clarkii]
MRSILRAWAWIWAACAYFHTFLPCHALAEPKAAVFGGVPIIDEKVWSQPGVVVPPPDDSDIQDYDYDYEESANTSDVSGLNTNNSSLRVTRRLNNVTKDSGDTVKLKCEFTGDPPPTRFKWYKNEAPVIEEKGRVNDRKYRLKTDGLQVYGTKLTIKDLEIHDKGYYKCEATNGEERAESTGILIVKPGQWRRVDEAPESKASIPSMEDLGVHFPNLPAGKLPGGVPGIPVVGNIPNLGGYVFPPPGPEKDEGQGYCQVYRGATCSGFIGNRSIYIYSPQHLADMEKRLTTAITVISHSNDLSAKCEDYAIKSLCYAALPLCNENTPEPEPRQLCREECEILVNDVCRMEYVIAKQHQLIGRKLPIPECEDLAPITSPDHLTCIRLGVQSEPLVEDEKCYMRNGETYRGMESHTESGRICEPWSQNQLYMRTAEYPELIGGHNYCRNPGGSETQPWCFVATEHSVSKEECAVQVCSDNTWVYILVAAIVGGTVFLSLIIALCMKRKAKSPKQPSPKAKTVELNALLPKQQQLRAREFPLANVRFMQELGEGAFGKVYKGELQGVSPDGSSVLVAIKTLKENATAKTRQDFHREVDLMTDLRHPNIVCLLGVVMKEEPMCMLFEHMSQGDLHEFLIAHSPRSDVSACSDDGMSQVVLEQPDMLIIATQIAAGMEYLASHHYVHRDLASRNCLVGENLTVKISDFGLSRDIYSSDYYRVQSKSLLPVRWMPPESILYGKFTTESDVWSFGVVLWEIFSYGLQPYYGYNNQEVIDMIRSRHLLPCPEDCPPRIYALMVECWHETPNRRPTFREIHGRLRSWQGLDNGGLVGALSGSVSGHSGSQHSSTGPSNNTGSTNLSSNTHPPHLHRPYHPGPHYPPPGPPHSPAYSAPYQPPPPPGMVPGLYPRLSAPMGHPQPVYLAQRSNVMGGSPVTIRVAQPQSLNMGTETQLANL